METSEMLDKTCPYRQMMPVQRVIVYYCAGGGVRSGHVCDDVSTPDFICPEVSRKLKEAA